jgi:hypothetical protein
MTEILSNDNGSGSGDEGSASGGHNNSYDEKERKGSISGSKSFCNSIYTLIFIGNKQLRELWRDPKAMSVALLNFQKISGVKVNMTFCQAGNETTKEKELMEKYLTEVKHEISTASGEGNAQVEVNLKDDDYILRGLKNVYKFIEIQ